MDFKKIYEQVLREASWSDGLNAVKEFLDKGVSVESKDFSYSTFRKLYPKSQFGLQEYMYYSIAWAYIRALGKRTKQFPGIGKGVMEKYPSADKRNILRKNMIGFSQDAAKMVNGVVPSGEKASLKISELVDPDSGKNYREIINTREPGVKSSSSKSPSINKELLTSFIVKHLSKIKDDPSVKEKVITKIYNLILAKNDRKSLSVEEQKELLFGEGFINLVKAKYGEFSGEFKQSLSLEI